MTTKTSTADPEVRTAARELVGSMAPNREAEVTDASRLAQDLGFDSLALIELMLVAEERFGLPPIDEAEASTVTTVGGLADLVAAVRGRAA
jgi:acyl carrier protein